MVLPLYHYGSFSRKIISWNISSRPNADLVIQTFQKAYHTRNCPAGLMFHSDRGSQYITFAFRKLLDELNVVQSFSKKAYPFDNACCESFFKLSIVFFRSGVFGAVPARTIARKYSKYKAFLYVGL